MKPLNIENAIIFFYEKKLRGAHIKLFVLIQ